MRCLALSSVLPAQSVVNGGSDDGVAGAPALRPLHDLAER